MTDKYYPSEQKYDRAKSAVQNYDREVGNHGNKAEYKLVAEGKAKKLEGEDLIDFVYNGLGGAPALTGVPAKEGEKKAAEARERIDKKRKVALNREKVTVK